MAKDKTYLQLTEVSNTGKTKVYSVESFGSHLGTVKWYAPWRRYAFYPDADTLFDAKCMNEIVVFINVLMSDRKLSNGKRTTA